jgi:sugar phosphate isomerase/epimerase
MVEFLGGSCLEDATAVFPGPRTAARGAALFDRLWMVHASDNNGSWDDHLLPGDRSIDWAGFFSNSNRMVFRNSGWFSGTQDGFPEL